MEPLQDFIDMLLIFQLILRVDYNIIQVGRIEVIKVVKEYIVYIPLVYSQSISQSKREYLIFIRSIIGLKYIKILRPRVYPNLVEGLTDIKLCKDLSLLIQARVLLSIGSRQRSLWVILFSLQQLIQKRSPLFSFLVKRISIVKGA